MSAPLCLASCFLPLDADNSRWWRRFQDELAHCGMELVLLSTAPSADRELRTILIPLWLQGYAQAYSVPSEPVTLEPSLAEALSRRDRTWSGQDHRELGEFRAGLAACQHVLRTVLNELQPAVVLVWGNSLPQSVVLQQLALQQGRPCWMIERGLLPGTFMIEMSGQSGQSELNWSFTLNRVLCESQATDLFFAAQTALQRDRQTKYAQADFLSPDEFHQRFNPERRKLVAFTLQHDAASCLVPEDYLGTGMHAPGFRSSQAAIRGLADAARRQDALVIVKPHPIDHTDYSQLEDNHVRVVRDVNLHSLMATADVVACMTSTTQYEALLLEKPVLLMARSPLAGKGVAYEALSPEALPDALDAAFERREHEARRIAARRFVHFVLKHFSVALSEGTPAGATFTDLAQFLLRNALFLPAAPSSSEGIAALGRAFDTWTQPGSPMSAAAPVAEQRPTPSTHRMKYHSHIGQDAWVAECLQFKRNGFFLDFGAFDGKTISNTLALEEGLGWRGICVEPNPRYYPTLCECRKCITVNVALWPKSRELVRFVDAHGLSSIEEFQSGDINAERRQQAAHSVIEVDTLNPNELLARFNAPKLIDYLTLDVEGAEFDILSALDLKTYAIALMTIEHNHDKERQEKMRNYLAQFGYEVVQNRNDDFFFHRGHLTRLLEAQRKAADPVAVCNHLYDTFPIAETAGDKQAQAKAPAKVSPAANGSPATKVMDALYRSPETLRIMANALRDQRAWDEAELLYQKLVRHYPDDLEIWRERLDCCRGKGHGVLADLLCEEALERHPEWQSALTTI